MKGVRGVESVESGECGEYEGVESVRGCGECEVGGGGELTDITFGNVDLLANTQHNLWINNVSRFRLSMIDH